MEATKILLVDDQRQCLHALQAALEHPGYELVLASSGEAALKALLHHDVAVILMDVEMPGIDGFQTATLIREREKARQIPIIFVTGVMADVQAVFRGYTMGAVDYLLKPLDAHALRAKVSVFVALWHQKREIERTSEALRLAEMRERTYIEALYDVTFEDAPIGIGHASQDGHWVRVNPRLADILGCGREQLLARSFQDVVHPADRGRLLENVGRVASGAEPRHRGQYRFLHADGATLWIALTVSFIRGLNGQAVHLAIVEDISEEKQLALALEASERRFARLREAGLIGIFHEAPDGIITEANVAFLKIIGYTEEEVRAGKLSATLLAAPGYAEVEMRARAELRECGQCATHEKEYMRKDGGRAYVIEGAVTAGDTGAIGFALDVTVTKDAERERARFLSELQESIRVRDDFLNIAAHELRNPLTPLLVQVTNLRAMAARAMTPIEASWLARQLEPVERATIRLARLIESLLDVSRLTVGGVPLELENVDLAATVRDVAERMRPEIQRSECPLTVRTDVPVVGRWDRIRIDEVVANLLSNAVKYGAGKPIEVEVDSDEQEGHICVRDYGIGIPRQDHERIFERFGRAAPLQHYGGFGLGLWIVHRIVEAHHGRVELWSEPGKGSLFTVILPRIPLTEPACEPLGTKEEAWRTSSL